MNKRIPKVKTEIEKNTRIIQRERPWNQESHKPEDDTENEEEPKTQRTKDEEEAHK